VTEQNQIRRLTDAVHSIVDTVEDGLELFLGKIERTHETGWSPETLPMIHLANDARTLRALADRIDAERTRLIGPIFIVTGELHHAS
jgi:hypothetical protein